jgi:hypothetical protein
MENAPDFLSMLMILLREMNLALPRHFCTITYHKGSTSLYCEVGKPSISITATRARGYPEIPIQAHWIRG